MHKKVIGLLLLVSSGLFFLSQKALAVCPVCTIAVGAGLGLSRWFGIDDVITSLWIGGITVSLIIWTIDWLDKKEIIFSSRNLIVIASYYLLIFAPLYFSKIIGHPYNTFWGLDKIILGSFLGSVFFFLGVWSYNLIKKKRGKAYFPFQKVVMPIAPLIILSIIFYFLTK